MPNYCYYEMKIKGTDEAVDELLSMMKYNHPTLHFYRLFDADVYETGDGYACVNGHVAWSVYCAMLNYNGECKSIGKQFTTIDKESERLCLEIEIFSSEQGIGFQEHYLFRNGEVVINDCEDYTEYYFDEFSYEAKTYEEKFAAFLEENELNITPDDLDENGSYCIGGVENFGDWTI